MIIPNLTHLYFEIHKRRKRYEVIKIHYLKLEVYTMCVFALVFVLTTYFRDKRRHYNAWLSAIVVTVTSLVSFFLIYHLIIKFPIFLSDKILYSIFFSLLALYLCYDSFFVVNFRDEFFKENHSLQIFYGFHTDWLFFFWRDLVLSCKKDIKKALRRRERRKKRKEERKRELMGEESQRSS